MLQEIQFDKEKELIRATQAHNWCSMSPERGGADAVAWFEEKHEALKTMIIESAKHERHKEIAQETYEYVYGKLLSTYHDWINAKSNCASSAVAGPANFNVRKAEKNNNREHDKMKALLDFDKYAQKLINKRYAACFTAQEKQSSDLENITRQLAAAKHHQETMKAANKAHKAYIKDPDSAKTKELMAILSDALQDTVKNYKPAYSWEPHPFAPYQLTNNNANIKRMEQRVKELSTKQEAAEEVGTKETEFKNGLKVIQNYEEDRLQLLFDGKPEENVRRALKSHGFRWAPSQQAWQRKLTNNAIYSFKHHLMGCEAMQQFKL